MEFLDAYKFIHTKNTFTASVFWRMLHTSETIPGSKNWLQSFTLSTEATAPDLTV